ncbi:hydroxyacid-oxoacid transhydrogenase [Pseudalkalibacillus caeni]|uniref:hydroxyacid-oxoacid transhydrogenase n=1 Tax=Exobacillus caeni TaxID=2574798 RepID=A0A5R9F409_9BACL|nr:hydroxyacid-oxoacid transhydrogenase [Pseudalkalibacillus caeni]TLS38432.1 iron-containing alcohol dehydrogenase [Pseudalkalibacillus caeni]
MRDNFEFFSTKNVVFGNGSIQKLDKILQRFNAKNVLIITDEGIKNAGLLTKVSSLIEAKDYNVVIFDKAVPEPPVETAMECYEFAKNEQKTDVIIGLGGGSSIDLAKIVALLMEYGGHPRDYFGGENLVPGPIAPLIAIPTTAGTGSEVTSVAVLTDTENNLKVGISDNYLRPAVALLDPELTVNLPSFVTACSGIDALSHAVEAFTAKDFKYIQAEGELLFQGANPISDGLAYKAIELISQNLTLAVQQGSNLEARANMLMGSLLAGMAFSNAGTAAAHALAYPIGARSKAPHGLVTGLLLPYVMDYNNNVVPEKMAGIARAFNVSTDGLSSVEAGRKAVEAILELLSNIGLPTRLSEINIDKNDLAEIAEQALPIERLIRNNPRVPTKDSLIELLNKAY